MQTQAYFENIQQQIIQRVQGAQHSVLVAVAWLTDSAIFTELCNSAKKGLQVELLLVDDNINNDMAPFDHKRLEACGGKVYFIPSQNDGAIMHHKFCIIDDCTVITGSYNWSRKAQLNDENIVVIKDTSLATQFKNEFIVIKSNLNSLIDKVPELEIEQILVRCFLKNNPNKFGFCTADFKKIVIPCIYDEVYPFNSWYAKVIYGGEIRFVTRAGYVIKPANRTIFEGGFPDGIVPASIANKYNALSNEMLYGFVDKDNDKLIILPFVYEDVNIFCEDLASVKINGVWGYIDRDGREKIPFAYEWAGNFYNGNALVKINEKWGYTDKMGNQTIPCIYDGFYRYGDSMSYQIVELKKQKGYFDIIRHEICIPICYDDASFFFENLAAVKKGIKWGYINDKNEKVIDFLYDKVANFSEGFAAVMFEDKWGYINKYGELLIQYKFNSAGNFFNGRASI